VSPPATSRDAGEVLYAAMLDGGQQSVRHRPTDERIVT
jgi:hypothetical protein